MPASRPHRPGRDALKILKYIGPGLLVVVGFIDPGNWAANISAGSEFGYTLLWIVTLSTGMLIVLQHNVAHLGIVTGLCLAEAATLHAPKAASRTVLFTAMAASVSTSMAEILGGGIALEMLLGIPLAAGCFIVAFFVTALLLTDSYRLIEKIIMGFVSLIGLSFLYELKLVHIEWPSALAGWVGPALPDGSIFLVMCVLGAVVMPHNLYLHSEVIQSRQWNLEGDEVIRSGLKYEFYDTLFSMVVGWAINSAMMLLAASTFFAASSPVTELGQAKALLAPLLGEHASAVFALALLLAGLSSAVTSAYAGGTISAGMYGEPYNIRDNHSRLGAGLSMLGALAAIFIISNPFKALLVSQMVLSIQLPFTIFMQIYLTSSRKVMGRYVNKKSTTVILLLIGGCVSVLNAILFYSMIAG